MLRGSKLRMNFASLSAHCMVPTRVRSQANDATKRSVMTLPVAGMSVAVTTTPVPDCIGLVGVPPADVGIGGTTQLGSVLTLAVRLVSIWRIMSRCSPSLARSEGPSCADSLVNWADTTSRIDLVLAFANAAVALVMGGIGFFEPAIVN